MKDILKKILVPVGSNATDDPGVLIDNRGNVFFKGIIIMMIVVSLVFIIYNLIVELFTAALFDLILFVIMTVLYYLCHTQRFTLAKVMFLFAINAFLFLFALSYVADVGLYLIFLPLMAMALAIFPQKHLAFRYVFAGLSVILMTTILFFKPNWFPEVYIAPGLIQQTFLVNLYCSLAVLVITLYFLIYIIDNTDIRILRIAHALKVKNAELHQAYATLDKFTHSVSHDLRSPLSSIKGLCALAQLETQEEPTIEYLKKIDASADKLDSFIKTALRYYRNTVDGKTADIDLFDFVQDLFQHFRHVENSNRINFKQVFRMRETTFTIDAMLLRTIITNLISNGIKYHDASKQNPFISIEADYKNNMLYLKVIDNGKGISDSHITKIFSLFYTAGIDSDNSTGVGLHLVKEAIAKLNGSITVHSEVGYGTVFSIMIPTIGYAKSSFSKMPHLFPNIA